MRTPAVFLLALLLGGCGDDAPSGASRLEARPPQTAELVSPGEAIAGAFVPQLDPHTMNDAEIGKALPQGYRCAFRYTSTGKPVIAVGDDATAALKLNGKLALLPSAPVAHAFADGAAYEADGVRVVVTAAPPPTGRVRTRRDAILRFTVGSMLQVGYAGYYGCRSP